MALSVTHAAVVVTADDGTSEVGSNEWNAAHTLTGVASEAQGGTGLSALGTGVAAFLGTPSSANLATAVTDETGSGALVFANTPTLVTPALGAATATSVTASSSVNAVRYAVTSTTTASSVTIVGSTGATAAYTVTLPSSQGNASTFLQNNGSGVTSWATPTASIAPLTITSTSVVEQRDSTVAQTFRVYNTATAATTDYERGVFDWTTTLNTLTIGTQAGGTGTARNIALSPAGNIVAINANATAGQLTAANGPSGNPGIQLGASGSFRAYAGLDGIVTWAALPIGFASGSNLTSIDTAIGRVAAALLEVNTGTASGVGYMRLNGVAVASLPAASATYKGARGTVTDANSTTFLASVVAATSTTTAQIVPVFCNGTAWLIG